MNNTKSVEKQVTEDLEKTSEQTTFKIPEDMYAIAENLINAQRGMHYWTNLYHKIVEDFWNQLKERFGLKIDKYVYFFNHETYEIIRKQKKEGYNENSEST